MSSFRRNSKTNFQEETPAENPEEPAPESQHQQDQDQPTSSSRILNSDDDDDDIVIQKRRTIIDDDEFVEKEEGERSRSGSPVGQNQKRRNLIGSDLSDNSDNEEEPTKRNTEDVGSSFPEKKRGVNLRSAN